MPEELMDDSNALGYLRSEHDTIRSLLATCAGDFQPDLKKQAVIPLLQELRIHSQLEQNFFFPFMTSHVDEELIAGPANQNKELDDLTRQLQVTAPHDPLFPSLLQEIDTLLQHHIYDQEENLFLKVEGGPPDTHNALVKIANQMKNRREELLDEMKRPRKTDFTGDLAVTPDDVQLRIAQEKGRGIYPPRDNVSEAEFDAATGGSSIDIAESADAEMSSLGRRQVTLDHAPDVRIEDDIDSSAPDSEGMIERSVDTANKAALPESRAALNAEVNQNVTPADQDIAEQADLSAEQARSDEDGSAVAAKMPLLEEIGAVEKLPADNDPLLATGTEGLDAQTLQRNENMEAEKRASIVDADL